MKAIGIDLGTTNSVAAAGGRDTEILSSNANERLTPSVVSYVRKKKAESGEIVVGRMAVNNAVRDPERGRHVPLATRGAAEPLHHYFASPGADEIT